MSVGIGPQQKVWFVTGTSSGLGRAIVEAALASGDKVIATSRTLNKLKDLADAHPETCRVMQLDVTSDLKTMQAIALEAINIWGRIDVLVNNAGVGMLGIFEEIGTEGYEFQLRTNFLGQLDVTHAFLPHMRERRSGIIVFISSRSAWRSGLPMLGPYAASKAALNSATEALAVEVAPFNIRVLSVLPGSIRTENLTNTVYIPPMKVTNPEDPRQEIPEYKSMVDGTIDFVTQNVGKQPGSAMESAKVIVSVVRGDRIESKANQKEGGDWPDLNMLVLGSDALSNIREKCERILRSLDEWEGVARSIDIKNE